VAAVSPNPFPIVDAHQHFWDPRINYHPWLCDQPPIPFRYGDYAALRRPYLPADYVADAGRHRIVKTVYVETEWNPRDPIGEMRYVERLRRESGFPTVAVAQAFRPANPVAQAFRPANPPPPSARRAPGRPGSSGAPASRTRRPSRPARPSSFVARDSLPSASTRAAKLPLARNAVKASCSFALKERGPLTP